MTPTKNVKIDRPDDHITNEQVIGSVNAELTQKHRNDTAAIDKFAMLADRIEYYGLVDKRFSDEHPYWTSYVAYIRSGDYPNPGIDRNKPEFAKMLNDAVELIRGMPDEDVKRTKDDGMVEESDYSTIEEQKKLLKNALEDEDEIIRHGFCNRIEDCKKCLLGTPYQMATYGECRQHAKEMALDVAGIHAPFTRRVNATEGGL